MAILERLRCTVCGTAQLREKFGQVHEAEAVQQRFGGRGRCEWSSQPQSLEDALLLRDAMQAALARLEAGIAEAERG